MWETRLVRAHWFSLLALQVLAFPDREALHEAKVVGHAPDSGVPGELSFLPTFRILNRYERSLGPAA